MDLHRKTREMLKRDVIIASLGMKKLHTMNKNIWNQLKREKLTNMTKWMSVKELEQWVIYLGLNPKGISFVQALIKTKTLN